MTSRAFQAVVMCAGLGNRMTDLTKHIPKCFLPIAGIPMFWYPLNFLQKSLITEVILIVAERWLNEIKQLLSGADLPPLDDLKIDYVGLSDAVVESWGTADALRHISARIKNDFIVVSGDFVSDMNLTPMISFHNLEKAALTCLLCNRIVTGSVPGPKRKRSEGRDFIALSEDNRLLFVGAEEDYEETVSVNINMLNRYRTAYFTAKYNDCHVYIMKKWILNIIIKHRELASLKADLIPHMLEIGNEKEWKGLIGNVTVDPLDDMIRKFSFGVAAAKNSDSSPKILAYVLPPENGCIVAHVNTIGAYFEINKAIIRFLISRFSEKFSIGHRIESVSTAPGSESYINLSAELSQQNPNDASTSRSGRPIIKRSVIGARCIIGPKSKITNSLLMDDCIVGARAQITNSIICAHVKIGQNAEISSAIVVNNQIIPENAKIQNDVIAPEDEMELENWTDEC